jgi:pyruvate dehydrogenase E2 component (dihydrolipoamide acetyltransferase)
MSQLIEIKVPDIGDYKDIPVIEVLVKAGDAVQAEDSLLTLESDKATLDVPTPIAGVVKELKVQVGSRVSEGSLVVVLEAAEAAEVVGEQRAVSGERSVSAPAPVPAPETATSIAAPAATKMEPLTASPLPLTVPAAGSIPHASPSVRRFARELGVDVAKVPGSGPKGRILASDIQNYVKGVIAAAAAPAAPPAPSGLGLDLLPWPTVDFAKFGPIETQPLSRIKKISAANLSRNGIMIPAVTYHEDADITDLEAFRLQLNKENEKSGQKLTLLAFIIKATVRALQTFPEFNASLDGDNLVLKKYFHIAFAADTPNGLVVPVIKDADRKSVFEIARESGELAKAAREGKIKPADMQGACFTLSSVGGIGGTSFSPIINAPEVAILGISKAAMKPVWDGKTFVPRLTLPLSLTADHRVIDGALATRFNAYLATLLADFRRVAL